ncbi:MAG: hypothetical protein VB095_05420 [Anaerovorax sp.]|nr:hypothetical protein [Anaerovorax sp.]
MKTKKLVKEMACYSEKLTEANRILFEEILLTVRYSNIDERDAEEFSHHCLNLFLQAEQEGVDIKTILGTNDINAFCNDYVKQVYESYSLAKKAILKLLYIPRILLIFTGFFGMLLSILLPIWIKERAVTFDVAVTLSLTLNSILAIGIVYTALRYLGKFALKLNDPIKKQEKKWDFIIWGGYSFAVAFFVLSGLYLRQVLFHVNFILFLLICVALDRLFDYTVRKMN